MIKVPRIYLVLLVLIMACDKNRLDTPILSLTEETYFTSESEFRLALLNAYAKMTDWYWFRANDPMHHLYHLSGDDITEINGAYATFELFNGINPNDGYLSDYWDKSYELIQRANVIIEKATEADPADFDNSDFLAWNKGEALFLRALANFKLYNMFGTAPLITERLTSETTNTPRSEGTQLLDQVIIDMQEAIPLLPESWIESERGRVFKSSAKGLLVKALVFRGNYTGNASDYSEAVSVYSTITDRALTASYTDNFNAYTENNEESLFEFQASNGPNLDNVWLNNDGPWRGVESMTTYWGFYTVEGNQARNNLRGAPWIVTDKVYEAHGTDPRIAFFTEDDQSFTKYGKAGLDRLGGDGGQPSSSNNPRILRFADVKLLAAESMLRSGNTTGAIGLVNEVRSRAANWAMAADSIPGEMIELRDEGETSTSTIMQWIMDERLIELCGEEFVRWWDLKRWDASGDISLQGWTGAKEYFSTALSANFGFEYPKNLLMPIPQVEVERNSAILENNPGY